MEWWVLTTSNTIKHGYLRCSTMNRWKCIGRQGNTFTLINQQGKVIKADKLRVVNAIRSKSEEIVNIRVDSLGRVYVENNINKHSAIGNKIVLYHGSPNKNIKLQYGFGEDKHDYDKGFYLTPDKELAKEWAVCAGNSTGYLHKYELDLNNLRILDFDTLDQKAWIAELMKHRDADKLVNYYKNSKIFIDRFSVDITGYDVIKGRRADSSYFNIAKNFVRGNIDISILSELLRIGDLGVQYCLKSKKAMIDNIKETWEIEVVEGTKYKKLYDTRDSQARRKMKAMIEDSSINKLETTFFDLIKAGE